MKKKLLGFLNKDDNEDKFINEEESEYYDDEELVDAEDEDELEEETELQELPINLIDKGDKIIAISTVPGIDEDELEVTITREMLTIKTNSNIDFEYDDGDYLYDEIIFGEFYRSLLLPAEIDVDNSSAAIKKGVLIIEMPKIDKKVKKKLSVSSK